MKTYVIEFAGGTVPNANNQAIAAAGGTTALAAIDEAALSAVLASIVTSAIQPETCDNTDNNCNGCTDEGYGHYCNVASVCCPNATFAERQACLAAYDASVTPASPGGDPTLLPCTTIAQKDDPTTWLCHNPGDACDDTDNNCFLGVDEGQLKCGSPLACPTPEVCNGLDDDCDGQIDDGGVCQGCVPSPEICDGCDNDCNGIADDGAAVGAVVPCGLPSPPNCSGTLTCKPPTPNIPPGTCVGPGFDLNLCSSQPIAQSCDGVDNDCNGLVDDGIPPVS